MSVLCFLEEEEDDDVQRGIKRKYEDEEEGDD